MLNKQNVKVEYILPGFNY